MRVLKVMLAARYAFVPDREQVGLRRALILASIFFSLVLAISLNRYFSFYTSYDRIEFLCHDINVHIPHHLSTAIPSYNLRLAHHSLTQTLGTELRQYKFSWNLMKEITDRCHLYHSENAYQSFRSYLNR